MFDLKKITKYSPFCLSCLGRSVGLVGFGLDNRERGLEMINIIELSEEINVEKQLICPPEKCKICDGLVGEIENFTDLACDSISEYSLETFKIGTIVDKDILNTESEFANIFGANISESIKSQLNREIGIAVFQKNNISPRLNNPDSTIIIAVSYTHLTLPTIYSV